MKKILMLRYLPLARDVALMYHVCHQWPHTTMQMRCNRKLILPTSNKRWPTTPHWSRMRPSPHVLSLSSTLLVLCAKGVSTLSSPPPTVVGYQRYVHVQGKSTTTTTNGDAVPRRPPLLIIPGTAQSIEVWQQHIPVLSKSGRSVIICEPLGVGLTELPDHVELSLASQAETLKTTIETVLVQQPQTHENRETVDTPQHIPALDVVGFSLGGRIAMALACLYPEMVNRLHLTGVGLHRSVWGTLQIEAWKDILDHSSKEQNGGDLRGFAWSAMLASYSPDFLVGQKDKLPLWIDGLCQRHTVNGLRRLVHETLKQDEGPDWSVAAMAERLNEQQQQQQQPSGMIAGRLCVGQDDPLAPVDQVQGLAQALGWPTPTVIAKSAHVPPIENPRAWRQDLLDLLDNATADYT